MTGDERGGWSSLPRRSDFVSQPVWTSCRGLCWTLHGGLEVVSSDATLHSLSAPALLPASSRPRPVQTQQTAKPKPATPEPRPPEGHRGSRRYPFPKHQGHRPKITLDPAPQKYSWSARQKKRGSSLGTAGPLRKQPLMCLSPPRLTLGAEESVFLVPHGPTIAPRCPTAVIADKIKHIYFQKESKSLISAYHKHPALMQPVFTTVSTSCHTGRGLAGHPRCVSVGNDYGKTRLFSPIHWKTTMLATTLRSEDDQVLRAEVMNLLEKGAIEIIPPAQSESGFYSRYFLIPKKDGGLRPILDLRLLNSVLMKRSFRMITLKQILSQICPGNWFMSLDLKDAYCHI